MSDAYKDYIAGLAAGVSTVITGHPFDTVKVKLQKHSTEAHGIKYQNALHCTARILKNEGGEANRSIPQLQVILPSAAFGGAMISFILCPSELVKCRMQVQGTDSLVLKHQRYGGPLDCAVKTIKNEGVNGLFRGGFTTLLRESIGNAVFFSTYEYIRYYMQLQLIPALSGFSNEPNVLVDVGVGIMSGGAAGVAFWSAVLPLDVAKTVIQTAPDKRLSRNPFLTIQSIYWKSGFRGCYAGLGPTLVRAFPANAAAIVTWELAMRFLGIKRD